MLLAMPTLASPKLIPVPIVCAIPERPLTVEATSVAASVVSSAFFAACLEFNSKGIEIALAIILGRFFKALKSTPKPLKILPKMPP